VQALALLAQWVPQWAQWALSTVAFEFAWLVFLHRRQCWVVLAQQNWEQLDQKLVHWACLQHLVLDWVNLQDYEQCQRLYHHIWPHHNQPQMARQHLRLLVQQWPRVTSCHLHQLGSQW
jgi:hypothetical protein